MNAKRYATPLMPEISYGLVDLRGDVMGGVIASFLAIPAALSYGILVGLGPLSGLYGVLAANLFGALVGGSRGIISGPSPNVSIIMAVVVAEYATSISDVLLTVGLAGLIQMAFGLLRVGRYIAYVPSSLMEGFFCGVGVLLITVHSLRVLGFAPANGGLIGAVKAWPEALAGLNFDALAIAALAMAIGLLWRGRLLRLAPAQCVMLVFGALAGIFWFSGAPIVGEIETGLPRLQLPEASADALLRTVQPAFIMAMISSIGVLAMRMMVDSMTGREQQPNRLLVGHGVGSVASGLIGGLPVGVTDGTFSNVRIGGRTPVSNLIVAAVVLLTLFTGLSVVVEHIPRTVLAVILIMTGINIVNWRLLARIHQVQRDFAAVMLMTTVLVIFLDLIIGLVIGCIVATFVRSRAMSSVEIRGLISVPLLDRVILDEDDDKVDHFGASSGLVVFPSTATVASARELVRIIGRDVDGYRIVIFDLSYTVYLDDTAAMLMGRLINSAMSRGTHEFVIVGMSKDVADVMNSLRLLERVPKEDFAADLDEAKKIIKPMLLAELADGK